MEALDVVKEWDQSLRQSDWETARSKLADDATYVSIESGDAPSCADADEIVSLMRSWKGELPDVEVVQWQSVGDDVVARLRQPAWGDDADWYQVLTVKGDRIIKLRDFGDEAAAMRATSTA